MTGATPAIMAPHLDHMTAPKFEDGGSRLLLAGDSGVSPADSSDQSTQFLHDLPSAAGVSHRTW